MDKGKIIILNGTSSAGKSSIAKELCKIMDGDYKIVSGDDINDAFKQMFIQQFPFILEADPKKLELGSKALEPGVMSLINSTVQCLSIMGNNLIIDLVFAEEEWLQLCIDALSNYSVIFVGVHCSIDELQRREIARGNRNIGSAKSLYTKAHTNKIYDFEVDTTNQTSEECASQLKNYIQTNSPQAFKKMWKNVI